MKRLFAFRRLCVATLTCLVAAWCATSARAEVTDRHRDVAREVFDRLIAAQEKPEGWKVWPPTLKVADDEVVNAFATHERSEKGLVPIVVINRGLIEKVAKFDPDVLAFTIGHEIGHLVHFHVKKYLERQDKYGKYGAATAMIAVGREDELEADLFGMKLALRAGYSHQGIRRNLAAMMDPKSGAHYCAFEGLETDHPAWEARASYLQQDEVQAQLWRSMVAFRNGVLFLETENYAHAEFCFERVTEEFPECYEGWANLGYALLMQYCDALDEEDLRKFDIGHLVVGGFYRRPDSLSSQVRGVDEDLWFDAVGALREALRLKERLKLEDDMLLVKANLAVAYLIHPSGKQVGEAEKYFGDVLQALEQPKNAEALEPLVKAAIYINAGAGRGADESLVKRAREELKLAAKQPGREQSIQKLQAAMDYSQARAMVGSVSKEARQSAIGKFETYLTTISPASSWWSLAYGEYDQLAKDLGQEPKSAESFKHPLGVNDWRPVTSIQIPDGPLLGLSEPFADVLKALGEPDVTVPVLSGTNVQRCQYQDHGLTILGSREVLAVFLQSEQSPPIALKRPGLGGQTTSIRVGMPRSELEALLGDEWDVQFSSIDDADTVYTLYRSVGVAARFDGDRVKELVVVVVPRKK